MDLNGTCPELTLGASLRLLKTGLPAANFDAVRLGMCLGMNIRRWFGPGTNFVPAGNNRRTAEGLVAGSPGSARVGTAGRRVLAAGFSAVWLPLSARAWPGPACGTRNNRGSVAAETRDGLGKPIP